ncbi:hypothetical protein NXY56_003333 [Leishmania guyanensis]|uniref:Uncharacterized protein n=1 Tax=Leishmania guyanensis TaxID=5670 RepID=A0A1E1IXI8_LEIGU|nr:hypothetical protein, conserved [Leishmania guyanensis]
MPYYENHLYGPAERTPSPRQLRLPVATESPMRAARSEGPLIPTDENDNDAAEWPIRRNRRIPSPILSPIPTNPAYYSHHEEDDYNSNLQEGAGEAQQRRWMRERDSSRHPPVEPVVGHNLSSNPRTEEAFLSIPRAASLLQTRQVQAPSTGPRARAEVEAFTEDQQDADEHMTEEGLVSSRPFPTGWDARERPSFGTAPYRSAADEADYSAEPVARPQWLAHNSDESAHQSRSVRSARRYEDEGSERYRALWAGPERQVPRKSLPVRCARCDYRLPEELIEYLLETSMYHSVPQPHCPECGAQLAPIAQATYGDGDDNVYHSEREPPRRRERRSKRVNMPPKGPYERRSISAESSNTDIGVIDAVSSSNGDSRHESQLSPGVTPRPSHSKIEPENPAPLPPPRQPKAPMPPPRFGAPGGTGWTPRETPIIVLAKSPYLTLDSLPRSLHSATKGVTPSSDWHPGEEVTSAISPGNIAVPWAVEGCTACRRQAGVGLAGLFCCAMPCVLFRERKQLLLHTPSSRYICCAGAFPCCVPPASLRPELYYTVGPNYLYSSAMDAETTRYLDSVEDPTTAASQQRHRYDLYSAIDDEGEEQVTALRLGGGGRPPLAAFRSVTGVTSPALLVNPQTGLPLDGCYSKLADHGVDRPFANRATSPTSAPPGTGCCDCITWIDNTCVCDKTRGCCLYCTHPTAYCLACPMLCLCCEMTWCMPCALWTNRLLIRQHYHLLPDTAIDGGAVCCYRSYLQCCTLACTQAYTPTMASGTSTRVESTAAATASPTSLSCWFQLTITVAACLAAVFCLCPCAACGLAQQRDQIQRLGYPLVVQIPSETEMA